MCGSGCYLDDSVDQVSVWHLEALGICGWVDDCTTTAACLGCLGYFEQCSILLATSFKFITAVANFKGLPSPLTVGLFTKPEPV